MMMKQHSLAFSACTKTPFLIRRRQERGFCKSEIQELTFVNDCISEQKNEIIGVFLQNYIALFKRYKLESINCRIKVFFSIGINYKNPV